MKYYDVEKKYSCGACAIRNCLVEHGIDVSELYLRKLSDTSIDGADEKMLLQAANHFVETKVYQGSSIDVFKRRISKCLKRNSTILLCVNDELHWISVVRYKNRKVRIIDPVYKEYRKKIVQELTMKQLSAMANIFSRKTNKTGYYFIELIKPTES